MCSCKASNDTIHKATAWQPNTVGIKLELSTTKITAYEASLNKRVASLMMYLCSATIAHTEVGGALFRLLESDSTRSLASRGASSCWALSSRWRTGSSTLRTWHPDLGRAPPAFPRSLCTGAGRCLLRLTFTSSLASGVWSLLVPGEPRPPSRPRHSLNLSGSSCGCKVGGYYGVTTDTLTV